MESEYLKNRREIKLGIKSPDGKKPVKRLSIKSVKRIAEDKLLSKISKEMKSENDRCEIMAPGCTGKMVCLHHIQKTGVKNRLIRKNLARSCGSCNSFIEQFPDHPISKKFTKSRFKK